MISWLTELHPALGAPLSACAAVALGLASYASARVLVGRKASAESSDLAINLFRVIATVLSLLLSLTFASLREETTETRRSVELEAAQLGRTFRDLELFGTAESRAARDLLLIYLDAIPEDEWAQLRDGRLSGETDATFGAAKRAIYELAPETLLQERVMNRLLQDIDEVNVTRAVRLTHRGATGAHGVFLAFTVMGFLWTTALLGVYAPTGRALTFVTFYCAFFGVVIHITLDLAYYYTGMAAVTPEPFEFLAHLVRSR